MGSGRNIHAQTVAKIAGWITEHRYRAGDRLPVEAAVSIELGVSRTVVREAVKTLVAKGLVATGPRVGTRVLPTDAWRLFDADVIEWRLQAGVDDVFIDDLMELRLAIEPAAAAAAARRATEEQRRDLIEKLGAMAAAASDKGDYLAADLAFHTAVLKATGNQFFTALAPIVGSVLTVSFRLSVTGRESALRSMPLHESVARAIAEGRADDASAALERLIRQARLDIESDRALSGAAIKGAA